MPKSNSSGTALATHSDVQGILGNLDPADIVAIMSLQPTIADIEEASVWLAGNADVSFRKATISPSSNFASSIPATSLNVTLVSVSTYTLACDLPMAIKPPTPCRSAMRRNKNI
jgi:hypothetical protein